MELETRDERIMLSNILEELMEDIDQHITCFAKYNMPTTGSETVAISPEQNKNKAGIFVWNVDSGRFEERKQE